MDQKNIYILIGTKCLRQCLQRFYDAAFSDVFIGYFFWNKDKDELIEKQLAFTKALLGGPQEYQGKSLIAAHRPLMVRKSHFMRRHVLLREALEAEGLSQDFIDIWLSKEKKFLSQIISKSA